MESSRIEDDVDEIYNYIEGCKRHHLSANKIIVDKEALYDLLDDLSHHMPKEISRYQKMLKQRDEILENAENKAANILADAQEQYSAMIEEHAIMQQAYEQAKITINAANQQAEEIIANARAQAEEIGNGAIYYTKDMLEMLQQTIISAYNAATQNSNALETALKMHLQTIQQNMSELDQTPMGREDAPTDEISQISQQQSMNQGEISEEDTDDED